MSKKFNLTPQMQEYFNSLPKAVQETLVQSGAKANSLEELKALTKGFSNKHSAWVTNPTVQSDNQTEMNVPIPSQLNTEFSKEYQEENQL